MFGRLQQIWVQFLLLSGDRKAKKECKREKVQQFCKDQENNENAIECQRLKCQDMKKRKDRRDCKIAQLVKYCDEDLHKNTITCKKLGIKQAKQVCIQNTLEQFCAEDNNEDTRICRRLKDDD